MDKESRILLQKIDCNCSDCLFMDRDLVKRQSSVDLHFKWQKDYFDLKRIKKLVKAKFWKENGDDRKSQLLIKEARKMRFEFDESECAIHYGTCEKFNKDVSFIPGVCQIEEQNCFQHRRD